MRKILAFVVNVVTRMECGQGMLLEQIEIRKSIQNTKKDVKNPHIVLF